MAPLGGVREGRRMGRTGGNAGAGAVPRPLSGGGGREPQGAGGAAEGAAEGERPQNYEKPRISN